MSDTVNDEFKLADLFLTTKDIVEKTFPKAKHYKIVCEQICHKMMMYDLATNLIVREVYFHQHWMSEFGTTHTTQFMRIVWKKKNSVGLSETIVVLDYDSGFEPIVKLSTEKVVR